MNQDDYFSISNLGEEFQIGEKEEIAACIACLGCAACAACLGAQFVLHVSY